MMRYTSTRYFTNHFECETNWLIKSKRLGLVLLNKWLCFKAALRACIYYAHAHGCSWVYSMLCTDRTAVPGTVVVDCTRGFCWDRNIVAQFSHKSIHCCIVLDETCSRNGAHHAFDFTWTDAFFTDVRQKWF